MLKIEAATRLKAGGLGYRSPFGDDSDHDAEYNNLEGWKKDVNAEGLTIQEDNGNFSAFKGKKLVGRWVKSKKAGWLDE